MKEFVEALRSSWLTLVFSGFFCRQIKTLLKLLIIPKQDNSQQNKQKKNILYSPTHTPHLHSLLQTLQNTPEKQNLTVITPGRSGTYWSLLLLSQFPTADFTIWQKASDWWFVLKCLLSFSPADRLSGITDKPDHRFVLMPQGNSKLIRMRLKPFRFSHTSHFCLLPPLSASVH